MDADDISLPERFEEQIKIFELKSEVHVVGSYYNIIDDKNNIKKQYKVPTKKEDIFFNLFYSTPFAHPSVMIRKNILMNNLYDSAPETSAVEDYELWARIYNKDNFYNINKFLFNYRIYGESFSDTKKKKMYQSGLLVSKFFFNKNYFYLKELLLKENNSIYFFRMLSVLNYDVSRKLFFSYTIKNLKQLHKILYFLCREFVRYCYYSY